MINKRLLLLLVLFLLGLLVIVLSRNKSEDKSYLKNSLGVLNPHSNRPTHPLVFFDKDTFYSGVEQAKNEGKAFTDHISGGVIPHHLFPGFIITDFFNRLSKQNPKTIILIGPNHYERGNFKALVSVYGWQTPFGIVEPNDVIINDLVRENLIKVNEEVVSEDHAVAGIMPFVKYYLPDAQVVPILISGYMSQEEVQVLANSLKGHMDKDTILVAAVDFSHYLTSQQAQEKDKSTLELMKNFSYKQLLSLNNDYLDSPPSIVTLQYVMQKMGKTNFKILQNTNSGILTNNHTSPTTSYFSIMYY